MNRLRAGSCKMVNPYNRHVYDVDLTLDNVDGIVFWTKNIGPFLDYLKEVKERGYPFIIQHTITGYPRELEERVVNARQTIEHVKKVASMYGPQVVVWRYDPILITSLTPVGWHLKNFEHLARELEGTTNEVVVSLAQTYKKTKRNVDEAAKNKHFEWQETEQFTDTLLHPFMTNLAAIARCYGFQIRACSQKKLLIPGSVEEARCVDAERLEAVSQRSLKSDVKLRGNRKECGCFASRDIGEYDTCPHDCVYCYAVQNREKALTRYKEHDPNSEFLFIPERSVNIEDIPVRKPKKEDPKGITIRVTQEKMF